MISVNGCGRLVQDPVLKKIESKDTSVCNFSLAVDEHRYVNGEKIKSTSFFDFETWDTSAETIAKYAKKGDTIVFKAIARQHTWETENGKRSKVVFRLEEFKLLSKNRDE